jgi:methionyl-tRNA formyltransferase
MRVLFIGGTRRGYLTLQAMLDAGLQVAGVLSLRQDEHEMARYEAAIRELAAARALPLRESRNARDPALVVWAGQELRAETAMAVGVRVMLPAPFFSAFARGCWAVHDSLLPKYRGFAPLNWAIINDEAETGVTLFRVSEAMDAGDVLLQRAISIGREEAAPQVYERVCAATCEVVVQGCRLLSTGEAALQRQDPRDATYTCSRTPADGWIDWSAPTRSVFNLIRALTFPYPGAFTNHEGRRLFLLAAQEIPAPLRYVGRIPGRVVALHADGAVDVLTGDGVLRVLEVSFGGDTRLKAAQVIRSVRTRLGLDAGLLLECMNRTNQPTPNTQS